MEVSIVMQDLEKKKKNFLPNLLSQIWFVLFVDDC
jgi:hypothetical protein